ncbi:immunoglobulin E-set domain-containing protein [Dictyostelium discoideum AX4]|uniref:Immunoglobulin E-set domain-containing protein n=1 Tax=Dictyostelium discoideum TaxID=44689 RepID=Q54CT6_DICDI|nr:immunoglobulin E-set domain-containing protein [Dictyostelium discoideum AX4]EAL61060.1 immunoglobulin E-set domain-containing protein [Dictyostelium discoideum AX4]|eukprot:XP_629455.1 immunoglobulin E-set domain-containing protein [Dictyostelium discoideum AX4]
MMKLLFSIIFTLLFINSIYSQYVSPLRINYYLNDNITIVTNVTKYYFTKWSLLRHVGERNDIRLVLDFTCNLNSTNKEERICTTSMTGKMAQLYGEDWYCNAVSGANGQTYSNHLPDSLYPFPIIYNYTKPSTQGSIITVSGEYLRFGTGNPFNIGGMTVNMTDRDQFYTDKFDSNNIRFDFPSGCGTVLFNLNEHISTFNTNIQYQNPKIKNSTIKFNFDSNNNNIEKLSKIQLNGDNFCNNVSLVNVTIGNELINSNDMISVDHGEIQFNFNSSKQLYTENIPITISAGGTQTIDKFFISFGPIINSINSVPTSTGGIVTINGKRLKLPPQESSKISSTSSSTLSSSSSSSSSFTSIDNDSGKYKIKIGNQYCKYIKSTINELTCNLPNGSGDNLPISITINEIGNSGGNSIVTFTYGIPIIESYKINGNIVELYGSSFGETNKTLILINGKIHQTPSLTDKEDIVQVFNNESMLTFKLSGNLVNANISIKTPNSKQSNSIQLETKLFVKSISSPKTIGSINSLQFYFINSTNENSIPTITIFNNNNNNSSTIIESNTTSKPNSISYDGSLSYQFQFPRGCGKKLIQVEIGNQFVNSSFSYSPPITMYCNKSETDSMLMNCFGDNFGNGDGNGGEDSTIITFSNQTISTISFNDTMFSFKLKESYYKSNLHINVCGIDSLIDYEIKLDSLLKSITLFDKFNTSGGFILINGDYLSLDNIKPSFKCSFDNTTYSSDQCKLINGTEIKCLVSSSGSGDSTKFNKTCSLYLNGIEQVDKKVQIYYHSPFVLNFTTTTTTTTTNTSKVENKKMEANGNSNNNNIVSSTTFKRIPIYKSKGGQVLIFGGNFYDPIESVTIGGVKCINPIFIDYDKLSCNLLPSKIKSNSDNLLYVNVTVGGQSGGGNIFKYDIDELNENENNDDDDDNESEKNKRLRWLVPAIIIPIVFVIGGLSVLVFIFKKKLPCFSKNNNELKNK